jgi:hypothetical protein
MAFAQHIGPLLLSAEELTWRPRLKVELDNLRASVGWAIERETDDDRELALQIVSFLSREAVLDRGSGIGGWAARAVDATTLSSSSWRPTVMVSAAYDAFHRGDLDVAERLAAEAFDASRVSDPPMAAWAEMARANCVASRGRLEEALSILDEVASWLPDSSIYDRHTIHSVIALYTSLTGDTDKALASAHIALDAAEALGQPSALALALYANGMVRDEIDPASARRYCEQSIDLTEKGASDVVYANSFGTLALMSARAGDVPEALRDVRRSIAYAHSIGDRPPMVGTLHTATRLLPPVDDPERFANLAGGILDGWFKPMGNIIPERDRLPASALAEVEAMLGSDRYRAARARGAAMRYDELVSLVLAALDAAIAVT